MTEMRLPKTAYEWALRHLIREGDTDLFPPLFEVQALQYNWKLLVKHLAQFDILNYHWKGGRRFVVPKDVLAFRSATQLDPVDSLFFAAIVSKYGARIEKQRIPVDQSRVYSYRFNPSPDGLFYGDKSSWTDFWKGSLERANSETCKWVAVTDITDYYNQVNHHVLERQLEEATVPMPIVKQLLSLLSGLSSGVSRGIPVGPHAAHLLAECSLIPTDRSLASRGYDFCRYVDDFHFFCSSKEEAEIAIYDFADILDKQQKLAIQKQKTRIMPVQEFRTLASQMIIDRPLTDEEGLLIWVIKKYSGGDPYRLVGLTDLSEEDLKAVEPQKLKRLFDYYLSRTPTDYPRIGWLLRRLAQVGAPGAVDRVLDNLSNLTPVLGDVGRYIMRASSNYQGPVEALGGRIVESLKIPLIEHSEYLQIMLHTLFSNVPGLDHIDSLTARYNKAGPAVRREIVLAAAAANQGHWIRERKDEFAVSDSWLRRSLLCGAPCLPGDEAEHWVRKLKKNLSLMEQLVVQWAFKKQNSTGIGSVSAAQL